MLANDIDLTTFFYNPNIHPERIRHPQARKYFRFAEKMGIAFVDADYDVQEWFVRAKGMEIRAAAPPALTCVLSAPRSMRMSAASR